MCVRFYGGGLFFPFPSVSSPEKSHPEQGSVLSSKHVFTLTLKPNILKIIEGHNSKILFKVREEKRKGLN